MLIKSIGVHRNSTSSILKVFLGFSAFRVVENHQDVRNQLRKSTRTYKDKGVLATLEIIISYIHNICICMYYSYRSAIATSSTKPIADITHWSSSCFGWDRRSSLPAGSTHAAQESRFYPRTELMWDAKKTPSRAAGRASSPRCFDWILLGQFVGVKLPCKWTNWNFLVPEIVGRYLKSQMLFWPSLLQLGLIDW